MGIVQLDVWLMHAAASGAPHVLSSFPSPPDALSPPATAFTVVLSTMSWASWLLKLGSTLDYPSLKDASVWLDKGVYIACTQLNVLVFGLYMVFA